MFQVKMSIQNWLNELGLRFGWVMPRLQYTSYCVFLLMMPVISSSQLIGIDAHVVKDKMIEQIISDYYKKLIQASEQSVVEGLYFNEILADYQSFGIDPNNSNFAVIGLDFYNEYKKAREEDLKNGNDVKVKSLLQGKFRDLFWNYFDKDSKAIIDNLNSLHKKTKNDLKKLTDAIDHIGKAEEVEVKAEYMEMLKKYGISSSQFEKLENAEKEWRALKVKYGSHLGAASEAYEIYQIIQKGMSEGAPSAKVGAFFTLGKKLAGLGADSEELLVANPMLWLVANLANQLFTIGEELYNATNRLGGMINKNLNQGCVGEDTYGLESPASNSQNGSFRRLFPHVTRACPISSDPKDEVFSSVFVNIEANHEVYFWLDKRWIGGKVKEHRGRYDIDAIGRWLRSEDRFEESKDLKAIIKFYNRDIGFTQYREEAVNVVSAIFEKAGDLVSTMSFCDDAALEDLIMFDGRVHSMLNVLNTAGHGVYSWRDIKDFYPALMDDVVNSMLRDYFDYGRDHTSRLVSVLDALQEINPIEFRGTIIDQNNEAVEGAEVIISPSVKLFDGTGDCGVTTSKSDGSFGFFAILKEDKVYHWTMFAQKENRQGIRESFDIDTRERKSIDVLLVLDNKAEEKMKEIEDALNALQIRAGETDRAITEKCGSIADILASIQISLSNKTNDLTQARELLRYQKELVKTVGTQLDALHSLEAQFNGASVEIIEAGKRLENASLKICEKLEASKDSEDPKVRERIATEMKQDVQILGTRLDDIQQKITDLNGLVQRIETDLTGLPKVAGSSTISDISDLSDSRMQLSSATDLLAGVKTLLSTLDQIKGEAGGLLQSGKQLSGDTEFNNRIESIYANIMGKGSGAVACLAKERLIANLDGEIVRIEQEISLFNQDLAAEGIIYDQFIQRLQSTKDVLASIGEEASIPETYYQRGRDGAVQAGFCAVLAEELVEDLKVEVPTLVGMSLNAAESSLSGSKLSSSRGTSIKPDNPDQSNKVTKQSIAPGQKVFEGTVITLDYYEELDEKQWLVDNTDCWPGSTAKWNEAEQKVSCYCDDGLVWNTERNACVTSQELVDKADCSSLPGSYAAWNEAKQQVECWCPQGKKWNDTQTSCIDDQDWLVTNTKCWPGTYAAWDDAANAVKCYCDKGLVWNATNTACVDPQDLVNSADCSAFPGSYAAWNEVNQRVECWCPKGKKWNDSNSACVDDLTTVQCWPGSYAVKDPLTNAVQCYCNAGLVWNATNTACVNPQDLVNSADCSGYPGSYAAWNEVNKRVECWCPQGKKWNDSNSACVDDASSVQCWPGSYAAIDPLTNAVKCYCNSGLVWNSTNTACIQPTNQTPDCNSHFPGSEAVFNQQTQQYECHCPQGMQWNSTKTACESSGPSQPEQHITEIVVTQQTVTISVWDHGCQDGDIINLSINGQNYLTGHTLTNAKKAFQVTLPTGTNRLEILAVDSGTDCPPKADKSQTLNSAAIHISHATKGGSQSWTLKMGARTSANFIVQG